MTNQELAKFLESHRRYTLEEIGDQDLGKLMAHVHDRATTRSLLDIYSGEREYSSSMPTATAYGDNKQLKSNRIKAGSKKAKERAVKAQQTRRRNRAAAEGIPIPQDEIGSGRQWPNDEIGAA
jgi:hypothetical protein